MGMIHDDLLQAFHGGAVYVLKLPSSRDRRDRYRMVENNSGILQRGY